MWYLRYAVSVAGIFRAISECCSTVYSWFIPAAARGAGAQGAFFRTAVEINNADESAADYRVA